jgi:uncharacterized protein (DUF2132 family)
MITIWVKEKQLAEFVKMLERIERVQPNEFNFEWRTAPSSDPACWIQLLISYNEYVHLKEKVDKGHSALPNI